MPSAGDAARAPRSNFALVHAPQLHAQQPTTGGDDSTEIVPGVHLLPGLSCNVLAVVDSQGVLVVDNGSSHDAERVSGLLEQHSAGPVRMAIDCYCADRRVGWSQNRCKPGRQRSSSLATGPVDSCEP